MCINKRVKNKNERKKFLMCMEYPRLLSLFRYGVGYLDVKEDGGRCAPLGRAAVVMAGGISHLSFGVVERRARGEEKKGGEVS